MSTSTSVHSNAFNFLSFILSQVDPRTGQYTCAISLPELKANNLCGPVVPLQLNFNPLNAADSGFGKGWNLQLSQFNPTNGVLSLYTGETFKVILGGPNGPVIPEQKIDSFHFHDLGNRRYRVEHKDGLVEILQVRQGEVALPVQMLSPQGHGVSLDYVAFGTEPLLSSITNDTDDTRLLSLERTTNLLEITLHPGSAFEAKFQMSILGGESKTLVLPTDDNASWRFNYVVESGLTCLKDVYTPTGGHETVVYSSRAHYFPGQAGRTLPRVASHKRDPGFGQPAIETRYEYDDRDNNFLGFGSGLSWSDDGLDNLYKVRTAYEYETREILWDALAGKAVRETRRVYNRFHLMTLEYTTQHNSDPDKSTLQTTETEYYIDPMLDFKDQQPYCQLPKKVTQTWRLVSATLPRHEEIVTTTFDDFGNPLTQVNANGVTETNEWYLAEGEDDCPADPQGFVRNLKSKTVTPAASKYGQAPTLQTRYTYTAELGLTGSGPWLAIRDEALVQLGGGEEHCLQQTAYKYFNTPTDPFIHGRKLLDTVTLYEKTTPTTTTTAYSYSKTRNARNGETVQHTVSTLTGFDGEKKIITLQHSLLNGEPLLNRDDNDVKIEYEYDRLGRVTKETVAPDTPYVASRIYTYALTNGGVDQKVMQCAKDVKGVETITYLDGHNRVIRETRRDADALGGDDQKYREIYRATYNNQEQMTSETVVDWEREKDVVLTSLFNYDDWGEQRSVMRPDGVEEHEVTDPIARTTTQWLEGMGKTITVNNLFDKPENVKRIDLGGHQISEHVYRYDGQGRTAEEQDAAGNVTGYEYDAFDRMTKTVLPDSNVVERQYAGHSREDLPIKISVNGVVLGEQGFDGLDRMILSITGGRESVYTFDPGQSQPNSVKRPSGVEIGYAYRPELGEDPEQRKAVESTAIYTYDPQNARLRTTEEVDPSGITHSLAREYFSTGELKSESRGQTGEVTRIMYYEYSRQARLMSYTDVLGQTQEYEYNARAQLTATRLGSTRSTFAYDNQAQLKTIETIDGAQRLQIDLEYDDFGREVLRTFDLGNQIKQTLSQAYDEVDRLIQRTLMQGSETLRDETYAYDERGRLVDYNCTGSQRPEDPYGKVIKGQLFGFDALDNLNFVETTFEGGRHSIFFEYCNEKDPCQLTGLTNSLTPARPDDPQYPPRIDFTYDADGNLLLDEVGRILGYDSLGRLISVSAQAGETATGYHYDSLDTLSGLDTAGGNERRFYQGDDLINQIKGADSSTFVRADNNVLAELQAGADPKSLLLASDDKNSVLCELSRDGRNEVAYSAYGHRADDGAPGGHLGYNGERREAQTGWYLLGNGYRAFNSLLMRFHSPDSWSPFGDGGMNPYAYCFGDPIGLTDKNGHSPVGWFVRVVKLTTKSKVAKGIPSSMKMVGKGKSSATLHKIAQSDVDSALNKVAYYKHQVDSFYGKAVPDNIANKYIGSVEQFNFMEGKVGQKLITRHSANQLKFFPEPPTEYLNLAYRDRNVYVSGLRKEASDRAIAQMITDRAAADAAARAAVRSEARAQARAAEELAKRNADVRSGNYKPKEKQLHYQWAQE